MTDPEPCGADPERHDAEGFAIPNEWCDYHPGYCPGDIAALDRIAAAVSRP